MNDRPRAPLRLVHPAKPTPAAPRGRRARHEADLFTPEEAARLRAALRHARVLFGTWACLADAMRMPKGSVMHTASGRYRVSAALAVRLARALGKPLESLCAPPSDAATCPTCGARRAP